MGGFPGGRAGGPPGEGDTRAETGGKGLTQWRFSPGRIPRPRDSLCQGPEAGLQEWGAGVPESLGPGSVHWGWRSRDLLFVVRYCVVPSVHIHWQTSSHAVFMNTVPFILLHSPARGQVMIAPFYRQENKPVPGPPDRRARPGFSPAGTEAASSCSSRSTRQAVLGNVFKFLIQSFGKILPRLKKYIYIHMRTKKQGHL